MASFGELNFESSRAFADDEDEDVSEPETLFGFVETETYIFSLVVGTFVYALHKLWSICM